MGAGLPCITLENVEGVTAVGATDEINVDGVTGFCVPPYDVAEMASKIALLARDRTLCERLGGAAHKKARESLTWQHVGRAYLDVAREACSR